MEFEEFEVLNHNTLDNIRALSGEDNEDLLSQIIEIFLADIPEQLEILETACAENDFNTIKSISHSMKSASANLGAMRISAIFKELERESSDDNPEFITELLKELKGEFKILSPLLKKIISTP